MTSSEDLSPQPRAEGRRVEWAVGILVLLLAAGTVWMGPRPTGDLYVALAAGRDIVAGKLNALDDWSFNTEGRIWVNQNWGTHMLYYLFFKATGGTDGHLTGDLGSGEIGLLTLKILLLLTGSAFLAMACRKRGVDWPIAMITAAGMVIGGKSFIDLRPNLTTLMFAPVMLFLLYRTIDRRRGIWLTMVVFGVIWANLHGGFIFGLAVMGLWGICMIVPPLLYNRLWRRVLLGLLWSVAAGLLAGGLTAELGGRGSPAMPVGVVIAVACLAAHLAFTIRKHLTGAAAADGKADLRSGLSASWGAGWPYAAATGGAIVLAAVVTPFGVQNLFRTDTVNKPLEIWNLSHPLIMRDPTWRQVIEWRSVYEASTRTFATTWEFFTILAVVSFLICCHVIYKVLKNRKLTLEDAALVVAVAVLAAVIVLKAQPVYEKFSIHPSLKGNAAAAPLRKGWLAAIIVFSTLGLVAAVASIGVAGKLILRRRIERFTPRQVGVLIFDVAMTGIGIGMAFKSRRFIPLSLLLIGPVAARQMQWLLRTLGRGLAGMPASSGEAAPPPLPAEANEAAEQRPGGRGRGALYAIPTLVAGLALLTAVGFQTRRNIYRYLPGSPLVRHRSMLKNMILYQVFPPGPRDFINANALAGRCFNEWRWEGYLRWYCPQLKAFVGGRAQQVYSLDTYRKQQGLLRGQEGPTMLEQMGVRWMVIPKNINYRVLLHNALTGKSAKWVAVYHDGENYVLANPALPECREVISQCLQGKLEYPDPAIAALSRARCLSSPRIGKFALAVDLVKESQKHRPILATYELLRKLYNSTQTVPGQEIAYFEAHLRRLKAMETDRQNGIEVLQCREQAIRMLLSLYRLTKNREGLAHVDKEATELNEEFKAMAEKWN